jgi:prophage regulatory protein
MRFLLYPDLRSLGIPYGPDHLRRKVKAEEFPAPVLLSAARIAWVEAEVLEWLEARVAERDASLAARVQAKIGEPKRDATPPVQRDRARVVAKAATAPRRRRAPSTGNPHNSGAA